eukprot:4926658-Lingulodinium_polyedra.AAC.1
MRPVHSPAVLLPCTRAKSNFAGKVGSSTGRRTHARCVRQTQAPKHSPQTQPITNRTREHRPNTRLSNTKVRVQQLAKVVSVGILPISWTAAATRLSRDVPSESSLQRPVMAMLLRGLCGLCALLDGLLRGSQRRCEHANTGLRTQDMDQQRSIEHVNTRTQGAHDMRTREHANTARTVFINRHPAEHANTTRTQRSRTREHSRVHTNTAFMRTH